MAKDASKQETKPLPLTVPLALYEYLTWLARHSPLGSRETEVASHILTEAVRQMIANGEHNRTFPRDAGSSPDKLMEKFPQLDPAWPDEVKAKWFDAFARLMEVADGGKGTR